MTPTKLNESIIDVLNDLKARDILAIDIQKFTSIADFMIICTATSDRHLKAVFTHLTQELKENNIIPISKDNQNHAEWQILDYGDVIVHIMLDKAREFYQLEKLWMPMLEEVA